MKKEVNIIGGGLAGSECAYFLAEMGFAVKLYEMKPNKFSPAHHNPNLAEVVCSNSFKNEDVLTSSGLLKAELEILDSLLIKVAKECKVPSGGALAIDRELFSKKVDQIIRNHKNIKVINEEVTTFDATNSVWVVASGPLTSEPLLAYIQSLIGDKSLNFYDASCPIILKESLDFSKCFYQDRYSDVGKGDYINCPMTKEEYEEFYRELTNAEIVLLKDFEKGDIFEGCMPIEVMAKRGKDALRFGPLKPVGLSINPLNIKPYAVVQLRKENMQEESYNMVGFQTNLKFGEQKRVFSLIPALKNAEFIKYGVMHKNSYINSPKYLNKDLSLKTNKNIFFAGQLSGVEGYVESIASGLMVAISICLRYNNHTFNFGPDTMMGGLAWYITNEANKENFQPMNSNYSIVKSPEKKFKDKKLKRQEIYEASCNAILQIKEILNEFKRNNNNCS